MTSIRRFLTCAALGAFAAMLSFASVSHAQVRQTSIYIDNGHGLFTNLESLGTGTIQFPAVASTSTVLTTGNLSAITSLGTITSGTWNATPIGTQYGGTGLDLSAANGYLLFTGGVASTSATIPGTAITGDISGNAANVNNVVSLAHGGTGVDNTSLLAHNEVFATQDGTDGPATFRPLTAGDLPDISGSYIANNTSQQTGASFNIDGTGVIGSTLDVGGNMTIGGADVTAPKLSVTPTADGNYADGIAINPTTGTSGNNLLFFRNTAGNTDASWFTGRNSIGNTYEIGIQGLTPAMVGTSENDVPMSISSSTGNVSFGAGVAVGGLTTAGIVTNDANGNLGTTALGSLTSGTTGVTIGGTGNTVGANITVDITTASGSQDGLLSSTDWNTFNGKANSGANSDITSLTGLTTALAVSEGGTGAALTPATGDLITASSATAFTNLADVATGSVLVSGGVNASPSWSTLSGITVTSITGTANEITASASTGDVTLSLPATLVAPGTFGAGATTITTSAGDPVALTIANTGTGEDVSAQNWNVTQTGAATFNSGMTVGLGSTTLGTVGFYDGTTDNIVGTLQPATMSGTDTWTLPDASGTIALQGSAGTLTSDPTASPNWSASTGTAFESTDANVPVSITLPSPVSGKIIYVTWQQSSTVTLTPASGTILGGSSWATVPNTQGATLLGNGTNWYVVGTY